MKVRFSKDIPLLDVKTPKIGSIYHLSWARSHAMKWRLLKIDGNFVDMETPVTKKYMRAKLSDLKHLRSSQVKIIKGEMQQ